MTSNIENVGSVAWKVMDIPERVYKLTFYNYVDGSVSEKYYNSMRGATYAEIAFYKRVMLQKGGVSCSD